MRCPSQPCTLKIVNLTCRAIFLPCCQIVNKKKKKVTFCYLSASAPQPLPFNSLSSPTPLHIWPSQPIYLLLQTLAVRASALYLSSFHYVSLLTPASPSHMARGNLFNGAARGRVGDTIFYRRNGKQISRMRPASVKNPQSNSQMLTRLAFSSASKTAQHLRGIIDHSFQGVAYGQKSVNHFVSKLAKEILAATKVALAGTTSEAPYGTAPVLPFGAAGIGAGATALISSGDLKGMKFALCDDASEGCLYLGENVAQGADLQLLTLSDYETVFGVPASDQVTIIEAMPTKLDYISETQLFYGARFDYLRWNIKKDVASTTALFVAGLGAGKCKLNPAVLDMERTDPRVLNLIFEPSPIESAPLSVYTEGAGNIFGTGPAVNVCLAGVIVSRYENNVWRRSTCRLVRTPKLQVDTAIEFQTEYAFNDVEEVLASAATTKSVPENEYLNKKKVEA